MSLAIGIDLGTTYSAVAVVGPDGKPKLVHNREGELLTPSVVLFQGETPLVGSTAKQSRKTALDYYVDLVKRHIGMPSWRFDTPSGETYSAEQISALVLKRLKDDAEMMLGAPCDNAVISVPAYFDDTRRKATQDAGKIAGFNVMRIINEPTAAALAYGLDLSGTGTLLIYDLGGGTFDVTVMKVEGSSFEVVSTVGDRNLGGFDWDNALMEWAAAQIVGKGGADPLDDPDLEAELREKCELAKRTLTNVQVARVFMTIEGQTHTIEVDREVFEEITKTLLRRTEELVEEAVEIANIGFSQVDRLLLVGGSTRMPMVREAIQKQTGIVPEATINPDQAVALGAAIQADLSAAQVAGTTSKTEQAHGPIDISDVTSQAIGVVVAKLGGGEANSIIIPSNTTIPCKRSNSYETFTDDQTAINVQITEGDDEEIEYVEILGSATFRIPPYPVGAPVEVILSYDIDQTVHAEIIDRTTDSHLGEFEVDREKNLKKDEVEAMRNAMKELEVG